MPETELVPYTEDELYVVPKKEAKGEPAKICQMSTFQAALPGKKNFFKENKRIFIAITVVVVGLGIYWYYQHEKEKNKRKTFS